MSDGLDLTYKNFKEIIVSIIVGFSIGLSVIVPGISGSSIAMIMKVYDKMMYAFSNLFKKFKLCVIFLIPIGIGVVVGFALGFVLVKLLLNAFPFVTICFFVGLMIGTYPILFKEIKGEKPNTNKKILFVVGILVPLLITLLSMLAYSNNSLANINLGHYILFIIIGVLISLTQIIPGLSATVLLMMFGYYSALIDGVSSELFTNIKLIFVYISLVIGFVVGILLFSKIINKLLDKQRKPFFFTICGLSIGSVLAVFLGNECLEIYKSWNGNGMITDIILGILFLTVGFVATFLLYLFDKKKQEKIENKNN